MTMVPPRDTKRLLEKYTLQYQESYLGSPAEEYLTRRGITKEAANYFHLGFVADPDPEMRAYRGTLSIPYVTASGDVVGIKFRYLDGEHKKRYTATTGFEPKRLYNHE